MVDEITSKDVVYVILLPEPRQLSSRRFSRPGLLVRLVLRCACTSAGAHTGSDSEIECVIDKLRLLP